MRFFFNREVLYNFFHKNTVINLLFFFSITEISQAQYSTSFNTSEGTNTAAFVTLGWHSFPCYSTNASFPRTGDQHIRSGPGAACSAISPILDFGSTPGADIVSVWFRSSINAASSTITLQIADASTGAVVSGSTVTLTGLTTTYQQIQLSVTENTPYRVRITTNTLPNTPARALLDDFFSAVPIWSVPLTASLTYFKAIPLSNSIKLIWANTTEKNKQRMEIEKSNNAVDFLTIGSIDVRGSSFINNDYEFTDYSINTSENYYRLKQIDLEGNVWYSEIIFVRFRMDEELDWVEAFNATGQIVFSGKKSAFYRIANPQQLYIIKEFHRTYRLFMH